MNKNVIQFPLFVSSKPHCQAEFQYVESGLMQMCLSYPIIAYSLLGNSFRAPLLFIERDSL